MLWRKMSMENNDLFHVSAKTKDNLESIVDARGDVVITDDIENPTILMRKVVELNGLIDFYYNLQQMDNKTVSLKNEALEKIMKLLENCKNLNINFSPFCVYFQVLKMPFSSYLKISYSEKREVLIHVLEMYRENRYHLYQANPYSHQVLQVMSDAASSRRNGMTANIIISKMLESYKFIKPKTIYELDRTEKCYLFPDRSKDDLKIFNDYLRKKSVKFKFRSDREGKNPDALVKIGNDIFIIEHKLVTSNGGAQDKDINELIDFIRYSESNKSVHYVAFLQGNYWEYLTKSKSGKPSNNRIAIWGALNDNKSNYFVNGNGFQQLIEKFLNK